MTPRCFAAVDQGASSGRVVLGRLADGRFELTEVERFETPLIETADGLHWDAAALRRSLLDGLAKAVEAADGALESVGVDTWGVDYGRLDQAGELLEQPFAYRDRRTEGLPARFFEHFPPDRLYGIAGLQVMEFNTIYQFASQSRDPRWDEVASVLLLPDLANFWLTGRRAAEVTIASTTSLLDVRTRQWSPELEDHLDQIYGVPLRRVLPEVVEPGTVVGRTRPGLLPRDLEVVAVGGHDTASAVASIPAVGDDFAFISSGTWSLVGLELPAPITSEASRKADFTNELGVDGTVRYLKNVMGLWVLSECRRHWRGQGRDPGLSALLTAAEAVPPLAVVVDINDQRLLPRQDMPARLVELAAETAQTLPDDPAVVTRCIVDSLALAYRRAVRLGAKLADRDPQVVHIVGGGCQNKLLSQLTADATGLPVVTGPVEGAALGNLLVQARTLGALSGDLADLRQVASRSAATERYEPGRFVPAAAWDRAARRIGEDPA
ncbi:MAG: rhamnulokinase [Bifidobacteriaceae bacterium]|jgi:rhamnulokinase|nr:rhamnulokinase [Bifidobacteriaceae bacterium]